MTDFAESRSGDRRPPTMQRHAQTQRKERRERGRKGKMKAKKLRPLACRCRSRHLPLSTSHLSSHKTIPAATIGAHTRSLPPLSLRCLPPSLAPPIVFLLHCILVASLIHRYRTRSINLRLYRISCTRRWCAFGPDCRWSLDWSGGS